jgi:hypothetical protein
VKYVFAFGRFWYAFIVGDDWRVAAAIAIVIAATAALTDAGISSWWVMPAGVVVALYRSVVRGARGARRA